MRIFKASTKRGQSIIQMGERCIYHNLSDIYTNWSVAKQRAYDWCYNQYCNDKESTSFGIGSSNTFGFTASWYCNIDDNYGMRVETKDNSYFVIFDTTDDYSYLN